jgi:ribonuclease R
MKSSKSKKAVKQAAKQVKKSRSARTAARSAARAKVAKQPAKVANKTVKKKVAVAKKPVLSKPVLSKPALSKPSPIKPAPIKVALKAIAPKLDEASVVRSLQTAGRPLLWADLAAALKLSRKAEAVLKQIVDAAVHSGAVICNRRSEYLLPDRAGLIVGVVSGHRDGYGYVHADVRGDSTQPPVYLSHRQMSQVMHGDRVAVRIVGRDFKGRPEGTIVEVLERGTLEVVGRLHDEAGVFVVVPDNIRISHRILIPPDRVGTALAGQVVLVKLLEQPNKHSQPVGEISRTLGDHAAPGMETDIAIHAHGLPFEFPPEVTRAAEQFGESVAQNAKRNREDLRQLNLVTIDGEDARDFDDAVYCEKTKTGWKLIVAIADVASYVEPNSELDVEAQLRGTSVYFPNRVLPMLPEALSNGLCSLKPKVDRLCVCCEMQINPQGHITKTRFFEGLMCSAARLTYTQVAAYLANPDDVTAKAAQPFGVELRTLHELYKALHVARIARGAIDFDAPEVKLRFENGKIAAVLEQPRNDAHRLIEECMIAANIEAARFLSKHRIPTLYRVHGQPEEERLDKLQTFLRGFGVLLPQDRKLTSQDFSNILHSIAQDPTKGAEARLIETVVIRSMPQAMYQPENIGHFGLALENYLHFTSPIRRYPDLIVHRGIRHVLRGGTADDLPKCLQGLEAMGQQCSLKERRADEATRDAMSWLKCEFMSDKIGEEFDAIVTGVVDFGIFVQIKGMQIDGLVHVSGLGSDYFARDESGYRMVGQRSGKVYRLGDHLRVRLTNVVIDERKIDFELANVESRNAGHRDGGRREGGHRGSKNKFKPDQHRHRSGGSSGGFRGGKR